MAYDDWKLRSPYDERRGSDDWVPGEVIARCAHCGARIHDNDWLTTPALIRNTGEEFDGLDDGLYCDPDCQRVAEREVIESGLLAPEPCYDTIVEGVQRLPG